MQFEQPGLLFSDLFNDQFGGGGRVIVYIYIYKNKEGEGLLIMC